MLIFLQNWGMVMGPAFDVLGAILVFQGVRIGYQRAAALEKMAIPRLFDDIGSVENIQSNEKLALARARERIRASRWALAGLASFILGFGLQSYAGWPR